MTARRLVPLAFLLAFASGCGGESTPYERDAARLCRAFNEAAHVGHIEMERAREIFARLADGLDDLSPPDDLGTTHDVMLGFARGGERLHADAPRDAPKTDVRNMSGDYLDDVGRVERDLPDCADSLTGTHPEIQVIR